ncbi:Fic family protein [Ruminococcus sp. HUN007]|uniref:Fic family protein n=1 Tax=Ruminococcus sp. HUN007 TaxID=1514668 RepID=UPI001FA6EB09|nr:ATP-binding protein [Ruminococcus sp. HUN007]
MFTAYEDRIEIVSLGTLPPNQTKEGFFSGVSIPVNQKLSEILLQLHISEKSGRGVPRITAVYGEEVFQFKDNAISVTIPFERLNLWNSTGGISSAIPPVIPLVNPQDESGSIESRIIAFCKEPHSVLEIADMLGYKDKKTVRKYLKPLCEQGKIVRTIPDKPNSRNQKYISIYE